MRRYIIRFILFAALCFMLDYSLNLLLNRPSRHFDWRYGAVRDKIIKTDLLIIGSSRGARGIDTEMIHQKTGLDCFNFCYPGTNLLFHLYCFETFLHHQINKPKMVLLTVDDDYAFKENPWQGFRTDILHGHTKYNDVNELLINHNENHWLASYFNFPKLRSIHIGFSRQKGLPTDHITPSGFMPLNFQNKDFIFKFVDTTYIRYDQHNEMKSFLDAYIRIQRLCETNQIKLLVCIPPNYKRPSPSFYKRIKQLTKPQIPIITQDTNTKSYRDSTFYYDSSHLNYKGAIIYTNELINHILNHR
jgi:hypothetical protein